MAMGINTSISYVKAALSGTLYAEAEEQSRNHELATYTVNVSDDSGDLVALFQGMVYLKKGPIISK
jgi:acyl-CoA thioesterase